MVHAPTKVAFLDKDDPDTVDEQVYVPYQPQYSRRFQVSTTLRFLKIVSGYEENGEKISFNF